MSTKTTPEVSETVAPKRPTLTVEAGEVACQGKDGRTMFSFENGIAEIYDGERMVDDLGRLEPTLHFWVADSADDDSEQAMSFHIDGRRNLMMLRAYIDMVLSEYR
jgi:hypothetical protein